MSEPTLEQIAADDNEQFMGTRATSKLGDYTHTIAHELIALRERVLYIERYAGLAPLGYCTCGGGANHRKGCPSAVAELDAGVTREMLHHDLRQAESDRDNARNEAKMARADAIIFGVDHDLMLSRVKEYEATRDAALAEVKRLTDLMDRITQVPDVEMRGRGRNRHGVFNGLKKAKNLALEGLDGIPRFEPDEVAG